MSPALRLFCCGRNSIAKWMPLSSRPGIGRSRGLVAPIVSTIASYFARSSSAWTSMPTRQLVTNSTPSAFICSTRRLT